MRELGWKTSPEDGNDYFKDAINITKDSVGNVDLHTFTCRNICGQIGMFPGWPGERSNVQEAACALGLKKMFD